MGSIETMDGMDDGAGGRGGSDTPLILLSEQQRRRRNSHLLFQFPPTLRDRQQAKTKLQSAFQEGRTESGQLSSFATLISINIVVVTETVCNWRCLVSTPSS